MNCEPVHLHGYELDFELVVFKSELVQQGGGAWEQAEMGKNTSKCILIQNTKYPSNKCINTKYKILVPENVTKYNTCILYLKYRKYLFWIFHFLTIWYSRAFGFGLYNVHKALVNHTWLSWRCHTHNSSQNMSLILLHWAVIMGRVSTEPGKKMPLRSIG